MAGMAGMVVGQRAPMLKDHRNFPCLKVMSQERRMETMEAGEIHHLPA